MLWLLALLITCYAGMSIYVLHFWKTKAGTTYPLTKEHVLLGALLLVHTAWLWQLLLEQQMIHMGFGHALNLVSWLMLLLYWFASFFYRLQGLQLLLFPLAVFSLAIGYFLPGQHVPYSLSNWPFMAHIIASILAYSLFGIATLFAVLMWQLERDLHRKKVSSLMQFLPPLLSLEKLMFQSLWIGFILLTFSVLSGSVFAEYVFGVPFVWTHKSIFGMLSWLIYAILLYGRAVHHWRGRMAIRWVMVGFFCLMLAYIGSKFVLEVVLGRSV